MQETEDSELVAKYLAGDNKALEELVGRYFKQVFLFAKTYVKQDAEAEDVTQEAFVKAWKNLKKYNPEKKFKTWLFQITKNTCIDFLRKNKNFLPAENLGEEQMSLSLENLTDTAPLPEEVFDSTGFEEKLEKIISGLPENFKQAVNMHLQQGLTFQEIAEILSQPINTVKSRYRRALLLIKDTIKNKSNS